MATDGQGRWSLKLRHQVTRKMRWRAVFLGSQHRTPSVGVRHTIYVVPPLTASLGGSSVSAGRPFRLHGRTLPALAGRPVAAEVRRRGGRWHRVGPAGVRQNGRFRRTVTLDRAGRFQLRWHYHGGRRGNWLSAVSAPVAVDVR